MKRVFLIALVAGAIASSPAWAQNSSGQGQTQTQGQAQGQTQTPTPVFIALK